MNVYFTASIVGKNEYVKYYEQIINILKLKGCIVHAEHILNNSEADIQLKSREERLRFHKQLEKWIAECDFMVVESSFPSISVGYEISLAMERRKPVLILYSEGDPPSLFAHHENEKILCEKYSQDTLISIITDFLDFVHGESDTRFTFFLSSKQAAYLSSQAQKHRLPKSVYLRQLIDCDMKT